MKVLVPIKQVVDAGFNIVLKADGSGIDENRSKLIINPFDEIAIEEAVRLKERGRVEQITLITIGPSNCQSVLRSGLAMGADEAMHIETEKKFQPLSIAKILEQATHQLKPDLIIMGKQATDGDHNQTGQMLAGLLGWSQATFASSLNACGLNACGLNTSVLTTSGLSIDDKKITVTREVDGGLQTIQCQLPTVITTDLRLNTPRYIALPQIMASKQKPLTTLKLEDWSLNLSQKTRVLSVEKTPSRPRGIEVESARELINKLAHEAKVI